MPERASVFETTQIGKESTAGTLVAASKRILAWGIDIDPNTPAEMVRSMGQVFPTGIIRGKEWTQASAKGPLSYNDIVYLLSGCLKDVTPSTPTTNGVFTATITGSPTGGTVTFTFNGATTGTVAYNAAAGAVQTAIAALATVGSGNVTVTGGPGPGTPWVITFGGPLANTVLPLTASGAGLTGGTSPAIAITSTAASAARRWTYVPAQSAVDTIASFTFEKGSSAGASKFGYAQVQEFSLNFSRQKVEMDAKIIGRAVTDGISMTGSPTDIANVPASVPDVSVFVGSTVNGLTLLSRCLSLKLTLGSRLAPLMTLDNSQSSFAATIQDNASVVGELVLEHDSVSESLMTDLRASTTKFLRVIAASSQTIESGYPYRLIWTLPLDLKDGKRGDVDNVYAATYAFEAIYNSGFGGALEIVVDNNLTAL
jgi:hypothetical protein